jgi:hypothetical protein
MPATCTVDTREGFLGVLKCTSSEECYGVRMDKLHPNDLLARAGLKSGMVVTHVNGTEVATHEVGMEIMNEVKEKGEKLTLVYLTEKEAVEQGARERKTRNKWIVAVLLVLCALGGLLYAAVQTGRLDLIKLMGIDKMKAQGGGSGDPTMDMMGMGDVASMKDPITGKPDLASIMNSPQMQKLREQVKGLIPEDAAEKFKSNMAANAAGAAPAGAATD